MMRRVLKSAVLTVPLMTACGRDAKHDGVKEPPALPIVDQGNKPVVNKYELAQSILFEAVIRKLIDYPTYEQHIQSRTVPIFNGKKKAIIPIDDMEAKGIRNKEDAFKDLDWVKDFNPRKLGAAIIRIALHAQLIDDEEFLKLAETKTVPTFRDWVRVDYPEDKLLTNWIIDERSAFAGSIMPKDHE